MSHCWWALLAAMSLAACGNDAKPPGGSSPPTRPGASPRLFTEAEIAAYQADLRARLAPVATRACPGPLLRGVATAGPSGPVIVSLFEPTGALAACMGRLASTGTAKVLKADYAARKAELVALEQDCGAILEELVHEASAHEGGCSPYQVGVKAEPASLLPLMKLAHLLAFRAQRHVEAGAPAQALALLVDAIRLYQDLERGHVTLIAAMIATASIEIVSDHADAILNTAKLPADQLAELATALDRLIAASPSFADIMAAERDQMDLYDGMAPLEGAGWVPPGGWNEELRASATHAKADAEPFADPRDEAALMLAVSVETAKGHATACPPGATLAACAAGYDQLDAARTPHDGGDLKVLYAELVKEAAAGTADLDAVRLRIQRQVIQILASVAMPAFSRYVGKLARQVGRLAELRLHVQILRDGACPTDLGAATLASLRSPPLLGATLGLARTGDNLAVTLPAWASAPATPFKLTCP